MLLPKKTVVSPRRDEEQGLYMSAKPVFVLINIDLVGLLLILVTELQKKKKKKVGATRGVIKKV